MSCRIVVAGFEPFGKHVRNVSADVLGPLAASPPAGVQVQTVCLPVVFERAWVRLEERLAAMGAGAPDAVVLLGLFESTMHIRIERWALNLQDTEVLGHAAGGRARPARTDNAGQSPVDRPVIEGAPPLLATSLDAKAIGRSLAAAGHAVEVSISPGSFVCNDLYYRALHALSNRSKPIPCLFVHLPDRPRRRRVKLLGLPIPLIRGPIVRGMAMRHQVSTLRALIAGVARALDTLRT